MMGKESGLRGAAAAVRRAGARARALRIRRETLLPVIKKCRLPDLRPSHDRDYVTFGRWMIARKLVLFMMLFLGAVSLAVICRLKPLSGGGAAGRLPVYRYDSLLLRFESGRVAIKGKSGYVAYEGDVEGGAVNGTGTLYAPSGDVVYRGDFVDNQYSGEGERYYPGNRLWYQGGFAENEFAGEGRLYRENGTLAYEGGFADGMKDGHGILYDGSGKQVYEGNFRKDAVIYEELLGRTASEMAALYTGRRTVYLSDDESCIYLPDIGAMYRGGGGEDALDGQWRVAGLYVLKQSICPQGEELKTIPQVREAMGPVIYEGNTAVTMADATALHVLCDMPGTDSFGAGMETTELFDDCLRIDAYDSGQLIYLYRFDRELYQYTFFCRERNGSFLCYLVEEKNGMER